MLWFIFIFWFWLRFGFFGFESLTTFPKDGLISSEFDDATDITEDKSDNIRNKVIVCFVTIKTDFAPIFQSCYFFCMFLTKPLYPQYRISILQIVINERQNFLHT